MSEITAPSSLPPQSIKWPKVLGILNIVFGILGIGSSLFTFLSIPFTRGMLKLAASLQPEQADDAFWEKFDAVQAKWAWVSYTSGGVYLIANIILLLGGIACLKLKEKCRPMFLFYSAFTILYLAYSGWLMVATPMMREQTEAASFGPQRLDEAAMALQTKFSQIIGLGTLVFYFILPVFLIIWFIRKKITDDIGTHFS